MSGIRFTLRAAPDWRIDLSCLTPDRLKNADLSVLLRADVGGGRRPSLLGDLFSVRDGDREKVVIEGGSERFDFVGLGMTHGEMTVEGDVGVQPGRLMAGGRLRILGDAGHWVGAGMLGGMIEIAGDAGDHLGSGLSGERTGMRGGEIVVRGSAGAQAGDRLRRGLVIVEGDAGAYAGARMVAGTLIVCGAAGALPGYLMRRGTIVAGRAERLSPTFVEAPATVLIFTELLARSVAALSDRAGQAVRASKRRLVGDLAVMGKAELLTSG